MAPKDEYQAISIWQQLLDNERLGVMLTVIRAGGIRAGRQAACLGFQSYKVPRRLLANVPAQAGGRPTLLLLLIS